MHFYLVDKEAAPLRELIKLCDVAISLVHKRGKLLKLLRTNAVRKERDDVFNARLKRLKDLERVSHQVYLALRNPMGVEDSGGGIESIREEQLGALSHGAPAVGQQIVHRDSEASPHNPIGQE